MEFKLRYSAKLNTKKSLDINTNTDPTQFKKKKTSLVKYTLIIAYGV